MDVKKNIRIATIYTETDLRNRSIKSMDMLRWLRISEALAEKGYSVDMVVNHGSDKTKELSENLRQIPFERFNWRNYQVIKTLFDEGFKTLERKGGDKHPFIISKTTIVGKKNEPGIHFFGLARYRLFRVMSRINRRAKFITLLSEENVKLWKKNFGDKKNLLLVPTGVDSKIPKPGKNPFSEIKGKIVLYLGHVCDWQQRKSNLILQAHLNNLGYYLKSSGINLCLLGEGLTDKLNPNLVTYLGSVEHQKVWNYLHFADCGIVLAEGPEQNFESSKIYYYLRAGLPVVSECPVPNNKIIKRSKMGYIAPYNQPKKMAALIKKALNKNWPKKQAIKYVLENHTWKKRVEVYDQIFKKLIN